MRFKFGKNWQEFIQSARPEIVEHSKNSLGKAIGRLDGKSFLDVGSGSGLSSLAAVRLGASKVFSFDYDTDSVECTKRVKEAFAKEADWNVEQGSALDED